MPKITTLLKLTAVGLIALCMPRSTARRQAHREAFAVPADKPAQPIHSGQDK